MAEFICFIVAMVLFFLAAFGIPPVASRFNLVAAGLFFVTLGLVLGQGFPK